MFFNMRFIAMFITAVCVLFLINPTSFSEGHFMLNYMFSKILALGDILGNTG